MAKERKVHTDEAVELLAQWERSGEPMTKWCAARGLNWYSLSAYKGWLGTRWDTEPEMTFAEVIVALSEVLGFGVGVADEALTGLSAYDGHGTIGGGPEVFSHDPEEILAPAEQRQSLVLANRVQRVLDLLHPLGRDVHQRLEYLRP